MNTVLHSRFYVLHLKNNRTNRAQILVSDFATQFSFLCEHEFHYTRKFSTTLLSQTHVEGEIMYTCAHLCSGGNRQHFLRTVISLTHIVFFAYTTTECKSSLHSGNVMDSRKYSCRILSVDVISNVRAQKRGAHHTSRGARHTRPHAIGW